MAILAYHALRCDRWLHNGAIMKDFHAAQIDHEGDIGERVGIASQPVVVGQTGIHVFEQLAELEQGFRQQRGVESVGNVDLIVVAAHPVTHLGVIILDLVRPFGVVDVAVHDANADRAAGHVDAVVNPMHPKAHGGPVLGPGRSK